MRWVRPAITLIGMLAITAGFFVRLVAPEVYVPLVAVAITWWFRARDEEKKG